MSAPSAPRPGRRTAPRPAPAPGARPTPCATRARRRRQRRRTSIPYGYARTWIWWRTSPRPPPCACVRCRRRPPPPYDSPPYETPTPEMGLRTRPRPPRRGTAPLAAAYGPAGRDRGRGGGRGGGGVRERPVLVRHPRAGRGAAGRRTGERAGGVTDADLGAAVPLVTIRLRFDSRTRRIPHDDGHGRTAPVAQQKSVTLHLGDLDATVRPLPVTHTHHHTDRGRLVGAGPGLRGR